MKLHSRGHSMNVTVVFAISVLLVVNSVRFWAPSVQGPLISFKKHPKHSSRFQVCNRYMLFWLLNFQPWLVWLRGLSTGLRTTEPLVWSPIRAHAWASGQVPSRGCTRAAAHYCFPLFLPPSPLSKNKWVNKLSNIFSLQLVKSEGEPSTEAFSITYSISDSPLLCPLGVFPNEC